MNNISFFGAVIYIDLRGYTRIVEEKLLENIANIIYDYQELITQEIKNIFTHEQVATIEYMGDGVLIILKDTSNENLEENYTFPSDIYMTSKALSDLLNNFLIRKKQEYTGLDKIDFGIGISHGKIYQRSFFNGNNIEKRKMFFGTSLNRAAKIGDSMSKDYNHIAIDKNMYDDFVFRNLKETESKRFKKRENPLVHMYMT